jgi:hypothetical protein
MRLRSGLLARRRLRAGCARVARLARLSLITRAGQVGQAVVDGGQAVELRLAHRQGAGQVRQLGNDHATRGVAGAVIITAGTHS